MISLRSQWIYAFPHFLPHFFRTFLEWNFRRRQSEHTVPEPSVHGPPTKAKMRAPVPGTHAPSNPAATLRAVPVQRAGLWSDLTGNESFCSSSRSCKTTPPEFRRPLRLSLVWNRSTALQRAHPCNVPAHQPLSNYKLQRPDTDKTTERIALSESITAQKSEFKTRSPSSELRKVNSKQGPHPQSRKGDNPQWPAYIGS